MLRLPREQSAQRPPPISKPWRACRVQRMLRPWKAVTPISWAKQEAQKKSPECSRRNVSARPSSVTLTPPAGPEILPPTDVERHVSRRRRAAPGVAGPALPAQRLLETVDARGRGARPPSRQARVDARARRLAKPLTDGVLDSWLDIR